ncbi:MAG: D-alanine--D-alanine ligase [Pseudomonadota bacterium]|nr:D-alanine--D-alanine ligase [Pseudomonadota bacterium]
MIDKNSHILVLKGGESAERLISLESGKYIEKALKEIGYRVSSLDCKGDFVPKIISTNPDLCFNALHGPGGEDGKIQRILEECNIPYTHSGVNSSEIAMNKAVSKKIFNRNKLLTPNFELIDVERIETFEFHYPIVIKPIGQGSSLGVYTIHGESDRVSFLKDLSCWDFGESVIVEEYIRGRELTCAVIDNKPSMVMEIKTKNNFYDYNSKYCAGGSTHLIPAPIPEKVYNQTREMTIKSHTLIGCRGVTRADFIFGRGLNEKESLYILEVNTQPGMTKTSLVPELALKQGISYVDLVNLIIKGTS